MKKEMIEVDVHIPSIDGKSVAHKVKALVPAVYDEDYQDYILDDDALRIIENTKARYMGLLLPEEIKALRIRLGVTQKQMADLLQIGAKTWSRWETGRERPSRSMNILIRALEDGKIDLNYLRGSGTAKQPAYGRILHFSKLNQNNIPIAVSGLTDREFSSKEERVA
jgi:DNA-binding transcriptional regulator YiaG